MRIINTEKIPIKIWTDYVEESAMEQAKHLANFPFAFHHVAVMPDVHTGFGMPIGGVLATERVVVPNAVGVDIGCGMCAVRTPLNIKDLSRDLLKKIMGNVRQNIPVGFKKHKKSKKSLILKKDLKVVSQELKVAEKQIGTLGGGNHFIEFQKDEVGNVWIMVHSGSRNIGYKVANYYNDLAKKLNKDYEVKIPESWDLDYLFIDSKEGQAYLDEMQYCVDFALENRKMIIEVVVGIVVEVCNRFDLKILKKEFGKMINVAHNYARVEKHFGKRIVVHRKGATSAKKGELGIIPGSQGSFSYIVKGKGNPESFNSCSHGAGRKMSRKGAQENLDLEEEKRKLEEKGILHGIRSKRDLDEASGAYKDINEVMKNQKDLIEIVERLEPVGVVKG
ncbi:MAG: RtcB family protein [Candidatus Pacearchaeota archaeon]|nr:RtcB family protein [Candidatus Pacearchaeota archaeon]